MKKIAQMLYDTDIYIRGAYGPSNLGDDILLTVMVKMMRKVFPQARILTSADRPHLALRFLPEGNYVSLSKTVVTQLAILGGGGQLFDFSSNQKQVGRLASFAKDPVKIRHALKRMIVEMPTL
jgi:hypothetical protein